MNPPETSEEKKEKVFGEPEAKAESVEVLGQNELNEKVAKLCGWRFSHISPWGAPGRKVWVSPQQLQTSELPDYCNDLNACHKFEKGLDAAQQFAYEQSLATICYPKSWEPENYTSPVWYLIHATAEQRCRAFIAAMEKRDDVREATESREHGTP